MGCKSLRRWITQRDSIKDAMKDGTVKSRNRRRIRESKSNFLLLEEESYGLHQGKEMILLPKLYQNLEKHFVHQQDGLGEC